MPVSSADQIREVLSAEPQRADEIQESIRDKYGLEHSPAVSTIKTIMRAKGNDLALRLVKHQRVYWVHLDTDRHEAAARLSARVLRDSAGEKQPPKPRRVKSQMGQEGISEQVSDQVSEQVSEQVSDQVSEDAQIRTATLLPTVAASANRLASPRTCSKASQRKKSANATLVREKAEAKAEALMKRSVSRPMFPPDVRPDISLLRFAHVGSSCRFHNVGH